MAPQRSRLGLVDLFWTSFTAGIELTMLCRQSN